MKAIAAEAEHGVTQGHFRRSKIVHQARLREAHRD
jgi:hypothetical protein